MGGVVAGSLVLPRGVFAAGGDTMKVGLIGCGSRGNDALSNWVSFTEMSGDHIVEQHVHNLDIANWHIGHPPVSALDFGGRARRKTGNQFDFFRIESDYGDGVGVHSLCRQITGCYERVAEFFTGENGTKLGQRPAGND